MYICTKVVPSFQSRVVVAGNTTGEDDESIGGDRDPFEISDSVQPDQQACRWRGEVKKGSKLVGQKMLCGEGGHQRLPYISHLVHNDPKLTIILFLEKARLGNLATVDVWGSTYCKLIVYAGHALHASDWMFVGCVLQIRPCERVA